MAVDRFKTCGRCRNAFPLFEGEPELSMCPPCRKRRRASSRGVGLPECIEAMNGLKGTVRRVQLHRVSKP